MFFLLSQDPYLLELSPPNTKIASVEMYDVQDHEINDKEVVSITNAKKVMRYNDRDEFFDVNTLLRRNGFINSLSANRGEKRGSVVYLSGDVRYVRDDGVTFRSNSVQYHQDTDVLKGFEPFTLTDVKSQTVGKSFVYDIKNKKIDAEKIYSIVELEKK